MATLTLRDRTGATVAVALVDDCDLELLSSYSWHRGGRYVVRNDGKKKRALHREIMGLSAGDVRVVDHINGDPLDNRRANLRVGTQAQNLQNTSAIVKTSAHRGVCWDAYSGKWKAHGKINGRQKTIGRYLTEQEAAEAALAWRQQNMEWARA